MHVELPKEQFGELIGAAVMQSITQESRDTLIKAAIQNLLAKPDPSGYGEKLSPLQKAFNSAVYTCAVEIVRQKIEAELSDKIKDVVSEALEKAFTSERKDQLVNNMTEAIIKGFRVDY